MLSTAPRQSTSRNNPPSSLAPERPVPRSDSPISKRELAVYVGVGLAVCVLSTQVFLFLITIASRAYLGGPSVVIDGRSMEPAIQRGSVVVTIPPSEDMVGPGTIVVFDIDGRTVTHRVVDRSEDGIQTRGDNNARVDSTLLELQDIRGQGRLVVPFIGWPRVWFGEGAWFQFATWAALSLTAYATPAWVRRRFIPRFDVAR